MRLTIRLHSTAPHLADSNIVRSCLSLFDFERIQVSRTLGYANYYDIESRSLRGEDATPPPKDINFADYTNADLVCDLLRPSSVLTISYWGSKSKRMGEIIRAISLYSPKIDSFFSSSTDLTFGPHDIIDVFENEDGDDTVRLVDVGYFSYSISSDNYLGDLEALRDGFEHAEPFSRLRGELEHITGPLTLRLEL